MAKSSLFLMRAVVSLENPAPVFVKFPTEWVLLRSVQFRLLVNLQIDWSSINWHSRNPAYLVPVQPHLYLPILIQGFDCVPSSLMFKGAGAC